MSVSVIANSAAASVLPQRTTSPRVLSVTSDFPLPENTGLHMRLVNNLALVQRLGCRSSVMYFTTEERPDPDPAQLQSLCHGFTCAGPRANCSQFGRGRKLANKIDFLLRGIAGIGGKRYPFSLRYDAVGAEARIIAEARRVRAEYVVIPSVWVHYAPALTRSGFKVIADAIDVMTEVTAGTARQQRHNPLRRMGLYANYVACRTQERRFLPLCTEIWATSPNEAESLRRIAPGVNVIVVPNGLDEREFVPAPAAANDNVGFVGGFFYQPNIDAVLFLAEEVFPRLLQQRPAARLQLAGRAMSAGLERRLRRLPFVDLLGAVADSGRFMEQCAVIALPIFLRGGVPLKLVEAMARAKPVVARPELLNGLPVRDGFDLLVRKDAQSFAGAIADVLSDRALGQRLGANARETFLHNWSRTAAFETMASESVLAVRRADAD